MTIGIYALYWVEQDLIYIGQSQNIEDRFKAHLNALIGDRHVNRKMQKAFNSFGKPTYFIVEVCDTEQLNNKEIFWGMEFECLNPKIGLNISEPGVSGGRGVNHGSSKYSKITILRVFSLLYRTSLRITDIAAKTKTHNNLPRHILASTAHNWLREQYPEKYSIMLGRKRVRAKSFDAGYSIHSKRGVLRIFSLLYRTKLTLLAIANKTHTNEKLVSHIKLGTRHLWVHEDYPEKSDIISKNRPKVVRKTCI